MTRGINQGFISFLTEVNERIKKILKEMTIDGLGLTSIFNS